MLGIIFKVLQSRQTFYHWVTSPAWSDFFFFFFFLFFLSLSPFFFLWGEFHYVSLDGLNSQCRPTRLIFELRDPSAFASWLLGLKVYTIISSHRLLKKKKKSKYWESWSPQTDVHNSRKHIPLWLHLTALGVNIASGTSCMVHSSWTVTFHHYQPKPSWVKGQVTVLVLGDCCQTNRRGPEIECFGFNKILQK